MLGIGNSLISGNSIQTSYSLDLDGTDDMMIIDDIQTILRGSYTISYWIKLDDSTPAAAASSGYYNDGNDAFQLGILSSGNFNFLHETNNDSSALFNGAGDLDGSGTGLSGNSASDWFMITLTATLDSGSSATTFAFYSNANAISTDKTMSKANHTGTDTGGLGFGFGGRTRTAGNVGHIVGNIAECAIWNTALDADAVTALYNSGASLNPMINSGNYDNSSALVRYYNFDQGSGTTVTDQTGNANGTIQGNPTYSEVHPSA